MTHDELLEQLNWAVHEYDKAYDNTNYYYTALRAVVELHRPIKDMRENWYECEECRAVTDCSECYGVEFVEAPYPCPTIQAIEKELA